MPRKSRLSGWRINVSENRGNVSPNCIIVSEKRMEMNTDRDWLFKKAEQEDGCTVSVGGLAADLGAVQGLVLTASSNELIVTIHFDGRVTVNPKYSTDEAARALDRKSVV